METFIEVLTYIGYIIVALLCLMFMVVVHESGHYLFGKMLGFKIDEFSIGFGPAIYKRKGKKTGQIFAIRWLPLGGYCAFYGEEDTGEEKKEETKDEIPNVDVFDEIKEEPAVTMTSEEYDVAMGVKDAPAEEVAKKPISFNDQPEWKRIIVFIAGALFNYISAIIIISIFFMAYGDYTPTVTKVYETGVTQNFMVGDEIIEVNGKSLYTSVNINDLNAKLSKAGDKAEVTVIRNGERMKINVNRGHFKPTDDKGNPLLDDKGNPIEQDGFGITIGAYGRIKFGFFESIGRAFVFSFKIVGLLFSTLGKIFTGALAVKGNLGGPITTITTIANVSMVGFDAILYAVCVMSATLAIMNLLPLPALDGSKVVFTLIEWIRGGKPINRKVENTIHLVGLFLLFGMTIIFDILNFI